MRRAFSRTLVQAAKEDNRVVFLTGDLGFQVFEEFEAGFGPRYINVGVAEAQMVCAAAGLAYEGWRPVAYSIASFATGRAFEQIRASVAYPNLPVIIVGAGGGYSYAASGVTHHAADDLALMSLLPTMTVTAPGDPFEVSQLLMQLLRIPGPSYMRIGRFGEQVYEAQEAVALGKARLVRDGESVCILTTGDLATSALVAMETLGQEGIHPILYQMHTVKPLDVDTLEAVARKVHTILVVEEHVPAGGLFAALALWASARNSAPALMRLGPQDALVLGSPKREQLQSTLGYDVAAIIAAGRKAATR